MGDDPTWVEEEHAEETAELLGSDLDEGAVDLHFERPEDAKEDARRHAITSAGRIIQEKPQVSPYDCTPESSAVHP